MEFQKKMSQQEETYEEHLQRRMAETITRISTNPPGNQPKPKYQCDICQDTEFVSVITPEGHSVARECECRQQRRIERLIRASQITPEFRKKSLDDFVTEGRPQAVRAAYQAVQAYIADFETMRGDRQNSIALLGRPGAGKTHLLMAVSNALLNTGVAVMYFPWVEGFNDLKSDWDAASEKVYKLQHAEVLFIDDVFKGRRSTTPFQLEQLFAIINFRYLNHKPVLISSERTVREMCEIDEGVGSRLYEMCKRYTVTMQGGQELNYRLR